MRCLHQELSTDSSQHVRSALASVIMGMAPVLGKVMLASNKMDFDLDNNVNENAFQLLLAFELRNQKI